MSLYFFGDFSSFYASSSSGLGTVSLLWGSSSDARKAQEWLELPELCVCSAQSTVPASEALRSALLHALLHTCNETWACFLGPPILWPTSLASPVKSTVKSTGTNAASTKGHLSDMWGREDFQKMDILENLGTRRVFLRWTPQPVGFFGVFWVTWVANHSHGSLRPLPGRRCWKLSH